MTAVLNAADEDGPVVVSTNAEAVNRRLRIPKELDLQVEQTAERGNMTAHGVIVERLAESFTLPDASRRKGRLETEQLFAAMLATATMAETRLGIGNWMDDTRAVELVFQSARALIDTKEPTS